MKRRLDVASKASSFKSLRNGGAGLVIQVVVRRIKAYPNEILRLNTSSGYRQRQKLFRIHPFRTNHQKATPKCDSQEEHNPGIPGGHIALTATNNNGVQTPPNSLDMMHACLRKQVAFNRSILKNEEEVAVRASLLLAKRLRIVWSLC
jgi:hypothetical protein